MSIYRCGFNHARGNGQALRSASGLDSFLPAIAVPNMSGDNTSLTLWRGPKQKHKMSFANAWLKWFDVIEGGAAPLTQRMLELAELNGAHKVLDIGTGVGEPALSAAIRLHNGGHVLAIDRDPKMIALARYRAKAHGASNINFTVSDIETLALAPSSIDIVLARWSLMFVSDLSSALSKLSKAFRNGGKLVAATWASPDLVPALSLAKRTVQLHFNLPSSTFGQPKAFALSDVEATKRAFAEAGYYDVYAEPFTVAYEFESPASYIQYRLDVAGPLWDGIGIEASLADQEARRAIKKAMRPYLISDNRYRFLNRAYCIVGTAR